MQSALLNAHLIPAAPACAIDLQLLRWDGGAPSEAGPQTEPQAATERVTDRFLSMKRQLGTALQGVIDFTCTKVSGQPGCAECGRPAGLELCFTVPTQLALQAASSCD